MRIRAISQCGVTNHLPHLFVNTHPVELAAAEFHDRIIEMRALSPFQQLTLEIHEAALTDIETLMELRALLRDQDIHLAFDDFGVGQARIAELAAVSPDYVKFDRVLIAGIDRAPPERVRVLKCLVGALNEIQVIPLAEGIETEAEAAVCRELGFQLGQGFYFKRPAPMESFSDELAAAATSNGSSKRTGPSAGCETVLQAADDTMEAGRQVLLDALKSPLERLASAR
ncbi:MAG: EAL domain-containing protein [Planctomycetaceae bacterium]|nr:EAL domain-containing protein [Planctomycetaceae bacterium]